MKKIEINNNQLKNKIQIIRVSGNIKIMHIENNRPLGNSR